MIPERQIDLPAVNEERPTINPNTSNTFKTVNFIVDLPLRLEDSQLEIWAPGLMQSSRVVHVLAEFQIVDQESHCNNQRGDASHDRYKARRLAQVRRRLFQDKAW